MASTKGGVENKTDKAPNAFSAKAQFRVVLIRTQTRARFFLFFFGKGKLRPVSQQSGNINDDNKKKNKPVFMAETLEELVTHLLHVSLACAHTHTHTQMRR